DGNGNETSMQYDDTAESSCSGCGVGSGPRRVIYPTFTKEFFYDKRGRKVVEADMLSADQFVMTQFFYDVAGNLIARKDKEGRITGYVYDELNRLVKETDPLGGITEYAYDDRDNLLGLKDANGNVTRFEYDRNNRLTKETRPMGQETAYVYDEVGNLISKTDADGQVTSYEYDDAGRMSTKKLLSWKVEGEGHPAPYVPRVTTFSYDKVGSLRGYDDGTTSADYAYDDAHRKTSEHVNYGPFELGYSYSYFKNGRKKSFTNGGVTYDYTYDGTNQLKSVLIPGQGSITYNAYTWTRPKTITLPGGSRKEYTYDPLMRLKAITAKDPASHTFMSYNYKYSPMDNVTEKQTERGNHVYGYDELYRLTTVDNPVLNNEAFTYDPVGNRLTDAATPGLWSYDQNNELLGYGANVCRYDENGNLIQNADSAQTMNFFYDVENRLERVEDDGGSTVAQYYYDAFGRRLWKDVGGTKTYFHYADEGLIGEYNAGGIEIRSYGYKPDSTWTTDPLFMKQGGAYYWYHNDHLGTPMQMTASNGAVVWSAKYKAFGEADVDPGSTVANNLRFPGQYCDQETGLHYNWHRDYDPEIGRYVNEDYIGLSTGEFTLYLYALDNPLGLIDPTGLNGCTTDGQCLKCVVFAESRGRAGCLKAIAWTIKNRLGNRAFGSLNSICDIVKAKVPPANKVLEFKSYGRSNWNNCCNDTLCPTARKELEEVEAALKNLGTDPTEGATFFRSDGSAFSDNPWWDYEEVFVSGCTDFRFFKITEKPPLPPKKKRPKAGVSRKKGE
ncbi:MAG: RHS repeat-associated core domain-containing protein, partial [Pseudomonadota bacterium]